MPNAQRDNNNVPTALGVLNTDGKTVVPIQANPVNKTIKVSNGTTGTNYGPTNALRDQNFVPVMMGVSSADGVTPVAIYADSTGRLLVNSN